MTIGTAPTVLVVDDSATSCIVMKKQLEKFGCAVITVNDGPSALQLMENTRFDMILLDSFMPGMDGPEVVREIRTRETDMGMDRVPVIGITGEEDPALIARCRESGMDEVLIKPLREVALQKILTAWSTPMMSAAGRISPDDLKKVDLMTLFTQTSLEDLRQLREALQRGEVETVRRIIHRMKGAALTVGAEPAGQRLILIEKMLKGIVSAEQLPQELDQLESLFRQP